MCLTKALITSSLTLLRKVSWTGLADTRSFVELLEGFYIFIKIHDSQSPQSEHFFTFQLEQKTHYT
ncbi:hypothetical protein HID58_088676 [Brassica napus]|uniref:Uncharacterized protein n=1 Tax=Brassica napus TaxID=3708 RepID=A0ABQ7XZT7_BRANA|nr:hypothetical protein HID58_088676 [Brassica napus]